MSNLRHRQRSADFGERLRQARVSKDMTQDQLAERVGLRWRTSIHALESGRQSVTIDLCEKLADALGVEPAWLAFGG